MKAELQLFLHVLGAIVLFGATAAAAVLALAARRREQQLPLARAAFWTLAAVAIPGWVLMLAFGSWTKSEQGWPDGVRWIDIGVAVSDGGLILLLVAAAASWVWTRRPAGGWPVTVVALASCVQLVAIAVAWWVMSAKVPT